MHIVGITATVITVSHNLFESKSANHHCSRKNHSNKMVLIVKQAFLSVALLLLVVVAASSVVVADGATATSSLRGGNKKQFLRAQRIVEVENPSRAARRLPVKSEGVVVATTTSFFLPATQQEPKVGPTLDDWKVKCIKPSGCSGAGDICMWCLKALATTSATESSSGVKHCAESMCGNCSAENIRPFFSCGLKLEYPGKYYYPTDVTVNDGIDVEMNAGSIVEAGNTEGRAETPTTTTTITTAVATNATDPTTTVAPKSDSLWDTINCPSMFPGSGNDCVMIDGYSFKKCMYGELGPSVSCQCSVEQPIWSCTGVTINDEEEENKEKEEFFIAVDEKSDFEIDDNSTIIDESPPVFEIDNNSTIIDEFPPVFEIDDDNSTIIDDDNSTIIDEFPPVFEIDDDNSTIIDEFPPVLEIDDNNSTIIDEFPPVLEIDDDNSTIIDEFPPIFEIDDDDSTLVIDEIPPVILPVLVEEGEMVVGETPVTQPVPVEEEMVVVETPITKPAPVQEIDEVLAENLVTQPAPVEEMDEVVVVEIPVTQPAPVEEQEVAAVETPDVVIARVPVIEKEEKGKGPTAAAVIANPFPETCPMNMPRSSGKGATKCNMPSKEICCYSIQPSYAVVCNCDHKNGGKFNCVIGVPNDCPNDVNQNPNIVIQPPPPPPISIYSDVVEAEGSTAEEDTIVEIVDVSVTSGIQQQQNNARFCPFEQPKQGFECSTGQLDDISCCYGKTLCVCSLSSYTQKYAFTCMSGSGINCN
jgi:hypothetical protein